MLNLIQDLYKMLNRHKKSYIKVIFLNDDISLEKSGQSGKSYKSYISYIEFILFFSKTIKNKNIFIYFF